MSALVNADELGSRFSDYLKMAENGTDVVVCRQNVPVARLAPVSHPLPALNRTKLGCMAGTVEILGDLTEPLTPAVEWDMPK